MGLGSTIEVLLGTYNGGQFVRQQIESIFNQDYYNLKVLARDDGSTDETPDILNEYSERFPSRFNVVASNRVNGGILNNFLSLMKASTADYLCFSDQDDVWLPNKVSASKRTLDELERKSGAKTPLLVFTDLRVVDENLKTLYPSFWKRMGIDPEGARDFAKILGNPVVTGCTIMANRSLVELSFRMPAEASLHDRWMGFLASSLGEIGFLREQTVLYRQHGRNAIGIGKDEPRKSLFERLRRSPEVAELHVKRWRSCQVEAAAFLNTHGAELPTVKRKVLTAFCECETCDNRFVRVTNFIRHRFYSKGRLSKMAVMSHLWNARR